VADRGVVGIDGMGLGFSTQATYQGHAATSGSRCVPLRPGNAPTPHVVSANAVLRPCRARSSCCFFRVLVRFAAVFGTAVSQRAALAVPESPGRSRGHGSGSARLSDSPTSGFRLRPRVLIVEDNDTTREMYAWSMRAAGWLVEEAADGEAGLYAAALFEPDVIVMDLRLPVLDGIDATRRLRETELTRHIPIVACSALNRSEDAKNAGCSAFVTKPCLPEDLRALVESLARNRGPSDPKE
jgi:two-component system cell cycle response regulator DivK